MSTRGAALIEDAGDPIAMTEPDDSPDELADTATPGLDTALDFRAAERLAAHLNGLPFIPEAIPFSLCEMNEEQIRPAVHQALAVEDPAFEAVEDRIDVARFISSLSSEEAELLRLVYWEDRSQVSIARARGTYRMAISRAVAQILAKGGDALALGAT